MDRISALRNVEDALVDFEEGECTLADLEREVRGVLRTYAADLDGELGAYRAGGEGIEERVVVARSPEAARERVADLHEGAGEPTVEPLE